jgi:hypothetical protein
MNSEMNDNQPLDSRWFDLLADGELDTRRRRELFLRLDREPEGWRRCALALFEAQVLRADLRAEVLPPRAAGLLSAAHSRAWPARWRRGLALTAVCLAAFGFGWLLRGTPAASVAPAVVVNPPARGADNAAATPPGASVDPREMREEPPDSFMRLAGMLDVQFDEDGAQRNLAVPVLEGSGISLDWLAAQPTAISESVRSELERRGHRVWTQRQMLSVDLSDGRQVVFPVDQVQVKLTGRIVQ